MHNSLHSPYSSDVRALGTFQALPPPGIAQLRLADCHDDVEIFGVQILKVQDLNRLPMRKAWPDVESQSGWCPQKTRHPLICHTLPKAALGRVACRHPQVYSDLCGYGSNFQSWGQPRVLVFGAPFTSWRHFGKKFLSHSQMTMGNLPHVVVNLIFFGGFPNGHPM